MAVDIVINTRRQSIRRALEVWALVASVVACVFSGKGAAMVAAATPVAVNPEQFKVIPIATTQMLAMVPHFPVYGWIAALVVLIAAVATFKLSSDEDIRLQVILFASLTGCSVALMFWAFVGVALVLLPQVANGI
jgi:hypothetical protein